MSVSFLQLPLFLEFVLSPEFANSQKGTLSRLDAGAMKLAARSEIGKQAGPRLELN